MVPVFGMPKMPVHIRALVAFALAGCIAAGLAARGLPTAPEPVSISWVERLVEQLVLGLPIAVASAVPLWAASMAGGLTDELAGSADAPDTGRFSALFSSLAGFLFLSTGGPAHIAEALVSASFDANVVAQAVTTLTAGIKVAVALALPMLGASFLVEVGSALLARSAAPAHIQQIMAPARALVLLATVAFAVHRIAEIVAQYINSAR